MNLNRKVTITLLFDSLLRREQVENIWTRYETQFNVSLRNKGKTHTLELYKLSYMFLRNYVLELPTIPISFCKVDRNGIPKPLWPLRPLFVKKVDRNSKRIALCIARIYESITLEIDYSSEAITDPLQSVTFEAGDQEFKEFLVKFCHKYPKYLGTLQNSNGELPKMFTGLGKGPNGPSVACAHLDIPGIRKEEGLYESIIDLFTELGETNAIKMMEYNELDPSKTSDKSYIASKLGYSAEGGGKTRCFAIGDYWSQLSLKPIQVSLNRTLKSIGTDSTHNQNKGFKSLLRKSKGKVTYCFDLSSASDRIPAIMQKHRLELLGGKKLADSWYSVMTKRDFHIKYLKTKVRWEVGQPLGLLSSFPSFALWHHDTIQFVYNKLRKAKGENLRFFTDYTLLGDDVVIYDKDVADAYLKLMTQVYKIEINLTKSIIGSKEKNQIEFTKRLALNGSEMSSIKYNLMSKNDDVYIVDLIDILYERDFIPKVNTHYALGDFMSSDKSNLINFILWVRSASSTPFEGSSLDSPISRESFELKLKEIRRSKIMEKMDIIEAYLMDVNPLNKYYIDAALPHSELALGIGSFQMEDFLKLHPLVWAIKQNGLDLSYILAGLFADEAQDIAPAEYLPLVSTSSYFIDRKAKGIFLSKLIKEVYQCLLKEEQTVVST